MDTGSETIFEQSVLAGWKGFAHLEESLLGRSFHSDCKKTDSDLTGLEDQRLGQ